MDGILRPIHILRHGPLDYQYEMNPDGSYGQPKQDLTLQTRTACPADQEAVQLLYT